MLKNNVSIWIESHVFDDQQFWKRLLWSAYWQLTRLKGQLIVVETPTWPRISKKLSDKFQILKQIFSINAGLIYLICIEALKFRHLLLLTVTEIKKTSLRGCPISTKTHFLNESHNIAVLGCTIVSETKVCVFWLKWVLNLLK
jgi:hypothetical protein